MAATELQQGSAGLDGISSGVAIAIALVLVAINALFVAAEFALVRVRPARLRRLALEGGVRARVALYLVDHLTEALSVCQIGVTLCSLALGYLGEPAFAHLFTRLFAAAFTTAVPWVDQLALPAAIVCSFLLVTTLLVVLGEVVPKQVAIGISERVLLATAIPIRAFWFASYPLVVMLNGTARLLLRGTKLAGGAGEDPVHSREEIQQLMLLSAQTGQIGPVELNLLRNLFRFARRRTRDAMVPRGRVVSLDLAAGTAKELVVRAQQEGYSRYPVIEGDIDHVLGVLHVKDLRGSETATHEQLRAAARTPLFVPDTLALDRLLRRFQVERAHFAMVANEYGAVVGIVTLEDVLEELVGELRDEFDAEEQDPVRARPGGGWVLDPALPVDRALELVPDAPVAPEGIHTLAGLLQSELGRLPEAGDRVPFGAGHELVAAVVQGTRILRVELVPRA